MSTLPTLDSKRWLSAGAVRQLDRVAIEERGVPSALLMENAGRAVAARVARQLERGGPPALVLVGPGNNGGDGLVIARTLVNRGFDARVVFVGELAKLRELSGDVQLNARLWRDMQVLGGRFGRLLEVRSGADLAELDKELSGAAIVVDALFGTGLSRALRSPWSEVVHAVNAAGRHVVAVDLPSGLDADSGMVPEGGVAVRATETVTFVLPKRGLLTGSGPEHVGSLSVAEIGIPLDLIREALRAEHGLAPEGLPIDDQAAGELGR